MDPADALHCELDHVGHISMMPDRAIGAGRCGDRKQNIGYETSNRSMACYRKPPSPSP
jgi:hypothetical protein